MWKIEGVQLGPFLGLVDQGPVLVGVVFHFEERGTERANYVEERG